ncbi:unnamed protein product [Ambrosiozyma monospora]|uniref:Unnamed protein product n=1 Tax=Ambrosiozyma monospora TaxID=43982 RepID=A0ACB5T5A2_AMBMO|nr:unnamed protein product [Ambrosiozyma monospora]
MQHKRSQSLPRPQSQSQPMSSSYQQSTRPQSPRRTPSHASSINSASQSIQNLHFSSQSMASSRDINNINVPLPIPSSVGSAGSGSGSGSGSGIGPINSSANNDPKSKVKSVKLGLSSSTSSILPNKTKTHQHPHVHTKSTLNQLSQFIPPVSSSSTPTPSARSTNLNYGSVDNYDEESMSVLSGFTNANISHNLTLNSQLQSQYQPQSQPPPQQQLPHPYSSGSTHGRGTAIPHTRRPKSRLTIREKIPYYLPITTWLPNYNVSYFFHDLIAGLSLASYQIPLSMSFATAVAHVPAICGLLGLSFAPMVYMILGSVPQMIVGPEAAVSMIVGQAIEKLTRHNDEMDPVDLLVVLTSCSGAILFAFGLMRFGFIDNVLCGSLLKGFVTAIGLTMMIGSTMAILGLDVLLKLLPPDQHVHTPFDKICFIVSHLSQYNGFSTCVGSGSFVVLMFAKRIKKLFVEHKFKKASFFPEILIVVVVATVLSYVFDLEGHGLSVVGKIDTAGFRYKFPLSKDLRPLYGEVFGVAFMCAILGFFESSTAAKSLSSNLEIPVSSNRELIALGSIGLVIGSFGTLSSFGGYARSKLNSINGAKTPAAGMFMGLTTLFVTYYLTEYLYYLPNCVLQAVIATVGISLIQETPKDVMFHIRTRGYNELFTFVVTLTASIFFSIEIGVALGCFYSVMRVIKHSTGSRIQILCRVAGKDTFVNSEAFEMFSEDGDLKKKPVREFEVEGYKEFRSEARHHHDHDLLPEGQEWPLIEGESGEDELNNAINNGNGNDNKVNGEGEGKNKNLRSFN